MSAAVVDTHYAQGQRYAVQGYDVCHRVGTPSRGHALALVGQDQYRGLAADPFRSTGDKAIEDQIHQHQDRLPGHQIDDLEQPVGRRK